MTVYRLLSNCLQESSYYLEADDIQSVRLPVAVLATPPAPDYCSEHLVTHLWHEAYW
jgi:hypothetical protein